jgi:uncharacterized protein
MRARRASDKLLCKVQIPCVILLYALSINLLHVAGETKHMSVYLPIAQMSVDVFLLLFLGGITGILSGLFGVGGGFLMTPLLIFIGVPPPVAVASVSNQIIASSVSGFHSHWKKGNVDFRIGGLMLVGGILGSSIGVWIFSLLKGMGQIDLVISVSYVVFLTLIGGSMAVESTRTILRHRRATKDAAFLAAFRDTLEEAEPNMIRDIPVTDVAPAHSIKAVPMAWLPWKMQFPRSQMEMSVLLPIFVSAFIGVLVSILGIGGGFFMIPAMLYLLKMPASVVIGTSLFQVIFVTANVTFLQAITTQSVDIILAGLMLIGSAIGAQLGIRMGLRLPAEYLRAMLAVIVLLVAVRLGMDLFIAPDNLYSMTLKEIVP